jgi:deoxyadenosine kinase
MSLPIENPHIAISGLIGAGKSTLADMLAAELNLPVYHERVADNPYLEAFYGDMARHAFGLQISLLNTRFAEQQRIVWSGRGGVQDRSIYEDMVFARSLHAGGLMSQLELNTYETLFRNMSNFMQRPTMLVHLEVAPEVALERIRSRGRPMEAGITLEYLKNLSAEYRRFVVEINHAIPVISIDYSKFLDAKEIVKIIAGEYARLKVVRISKVTE